MLYTTLPNKRRKDKVLKVQSGGDMLQLDVRVKKERVTDTHSPPQGLPPTLHTTTSIGWDMGADSFQIRKRLFLWWVSESTHTSVHMWTGS